MGPGAYYLGEEEKHSLCEAIDNMEVSRYTTAHPSYVDRFEEEAKRYLHANYCLGMNSCTSALYAGIRGLHLRPGDEVIVPGYTFVATIAAVVLNGATPVFANVDASLSIDPVDAERRITNRTRAIIAVHMLGNSCDMDSLVSLCQKYNLFLIEDVAQAFGGSYKNKALGTLGEFGAYSLNSFKIITAGDGGLFVTANERLYNETFSFHDHGFYESNNRIITEQSTFGLNLRMHEFTGCVAYQQMLKLPEILKTLRQKKTLFKEVLGTNDKFQYRILNDRYGDCAQATVLTFSSVDLARRFCNFAHTHSMFESQKHCYPSMVQILKKELPNYNTNFAYMEKTKDLLMRSVIIACGMKDSYIGSQIGYLVTESENQICALAEEVKKIISDI